MMAEELRGEAVTTPELVSENRHPAVSNSENITEIVSENAPENAPETSSTMDQIDPANDIYVCKPDETIASIAVKFGLEPNKLLKINKGKELRGLTLKAKLWGNTKIRLRPAAKEPVTRKSKKRKQDIRATSMVDTTQFPGATGEPETTKVTVDVQHEGAPCMIQKKIDPILRNPKCSTSSQGNDSKSSAVSKKKKRDPITFPGTRCIVDVVDTNGRREQFKSVRALFRAKNLDVADTEKLNALGKAIQSKTAFIGLNISIRKRESSVRSSTTSPARNDKVNRKTKSVGDMPKAVDEREVLIRSTMVSPARDAKVNRESITVGSSPKSSKRTGSAVEGTPKAKKRRDSHRVTPKVTQKVHPAELKHSVPKIRSPKSKKKKKQANDKKPKLVSHPTSTDGKRRMRTTRMLTVHRPGTDEFELFKSFRGIFRAKGWEVNEKAVAEYRLALKTNALFRGYQITIDPKKMGPENGRKSVETKKVTSVPDQIWTTDSADDDVVTAEIILKWIMSKLVHEEYRKKPLTAMQIWTMWPPEFIVKYNREQLQVILEALTCGEQSVLMLTHSPSGTSCFSVRDIEDIANFSQSTEITYLDIDALAACSKGAAIGVEKSNRLQGLAKRLIPCSKVDSPAKARVTVKTEGEMVKSPSKTKNPKKSYQAVVRDIKNRARTAAREFLIKTGQISSNGEDNQDDSVTETTAQHPWSGDSNDIPKKKPASFCHSWAPEEAVAHTLEMKQKARMLEQAARALHRLIDSCTSKPN